MCFAEPLTQANWGHAGYSFSLARQKPSVGSRCLKLRSKSWTTSPARCVCFLVFSGCSMTPPHLSEMGLKTRNQIWMQDAKNLNASFTDGTGFISTDLAKLVPRRIFQGMRMRHEEGQGSDLPEVLFYILPAPLKLGFIAWNVNDRFIYFTCEWHFVF